MSRSKRTRKARMAARRLKRDAAFDQALERVELAHVRYANAVSNAVNIARALAMINASDMPELAKQALNWMLNPVGYANAMAAQEMQRRQEKGE